LSSIEIAKVLMKNLSAAFVRTIKVNEVQHC